MVSRRSVFRRGGGGIGTCSSPLAPKAPSHLVAALDGETTFELLRPQLDVGEGGVKRDT